MPDPRAHRDDIDDRAGLQLAAMVAEHERRKWSIVAHVVGLLSALGDQMRAGARDDRAKGRGE